MTKTKEIQANQIPNIHSLYATLSFHYSKQIIFHTTFKIANIVSFMHGTVIPMRLNQYLALAFSLLNSISTISIQYIQHKNKQRTNHSIIMDQIRNNWLRCTRSIRSVILMAFISFRKKKKKKNEDKLLLFNAQ